MKPFFPLNGDMKIMIGDLDFRIEKLLMLVRWERDVEVKSMI